MLFERAVGLEISPAHFCPALPTVDSEADMNDLLCYELCPL
jgi:hypothetical protein